MHPFTALIVADDDQFRKAVARLIVRLGGIPVPTTSSAQALHVLETAIPDLILTDLEMPGGDGADLVRAARAIPHLAGVPAILVTASPAEVARSALARAGATAHLLEKPFSSDDLAAAIGRVLGRMRPDGE